ncbi:MAG: hypothetical protein A2Y62_06690 [Candidatus Fischerbacteria bacterium RBG_13_37_8]|uniref:Tetratricopeptide repeat protein n=1 Tax=Candidatus Fischerbacteria bacterium RBG_13_37_8 TaxID=1817863 RepID=A0A1F5VM87_9BACT|nr:MAG: hypothetical protein A2Y62_06690 [Candidatus Fischerbacteria bacterium RBG_13_37_8]
MEHELLKQQAKEALEKGDYDTVIEICQGLQQVIPDDPDVVALLEEAQRAIQAQGMAGDEIFGVQSESMDFHNIEDTSGSGTSSGEYAEIEEAFRERDFNAAIMHCQEFLKTDPNNEDVKQKLQKALELQEAEPFLQSFISTGQTLLESGLYIDAIKQFEKVKIIDPSYPDIEDLLVQAKAAIHGDAYSASSMSSAPSAGGEPGAFTPTEDKVHSIIQEGEHLFAKGEYQQAIDVWSEVFMFDITNKEAHDLIEKARNEMIIVKGQIEKFLEEARKNIGDNDYDSADKVLKKALELNSNHEEANELYSMVASKKSTASDVDVLVKANVAYEAKDYRLALEMYQKLLEIQPDNPIAPGRIDECRKLLQKQEQINKLISDAHVFHMQGKKDSAIFALQKAMEIDPSNKEAEMFLNTIQASSAGAPTAAAAARPKEKSALAKIIPGIVILVVILAAVYFLFIKESPPPLTDQQPPPKTDPILPPPKTPPKTTPKPDTTPIKPLTPVDEKKLLALLDEAHNLKMDGNLHASLQKYQEVLTLKPDHEDAKAKVNELERNIAAIEAQRKGFMNEAEKYSNLQDFEAVVRVLKAAMEKFPNDPTFVSLLKDGYFNLGIASIKKKMCDMAIDYFKQLEFLDPADQSATPEIEIARSCSGKTTFEPSLKYQIDALTYRPFSPPALPAPPINSEQ